MGMFISAKVFKLKKVLFLVLCFCFIVSCDKADPLEQKLNSLDKTTVLQQSELKDLQDLLLQEQGNRKYSKLLDSQGEVIVEKFNSFLQNKGFEIAQEQQEIEISQINFYLESSGSIDGYLQGNTNYKNDIIDLIVDIKNFHDVKKINLSYITDKFTPISLGDNVNDITQALTIGSFRKAGNRANSDLNDILNKSFNIQDESEVTFVVSDMIYSVNGANVLSLLNAQKSFIKDAFNKALKKDPDLSTLILKLDSEFNGTYYSYNNSKTVLNSELRPYYIFVFGGQQYLDQLIKDLDLLNRKNVADYFYFSPSQEVPFYTVVKTQDDLGSYKLGRINQGAITSISDIKASRSNDNGFEFGIGVDYSKFYLPASYLEDYNNYTVEKGSYEVIDIYPFSDVVLNPASTNALSRYNRNVTQVINVGATGVSYNDLEISLDKKIPDWVYEVNTEDDLQIKQNMKKTFGFKYLFEGIYESYKLNTKQDQYAKFIIKIKK